jgi:glycerophosphoryl diester phosphodiesterase
VSASSILNIAHRGASGSFPENTLSAFKAAIDAGADMCELDVQMTRDGVAVVIHDETVDRTTNGKGAVAAMRFVELKRLDAGAKFAKRFAGERIPTLEEVLAAVKGRCALNIELKADGVESEVCKLVREYSALGTAIVSSFDWDSLARAHQIEPALRIGVLAEEKPELMLSQAIAMDAFAVHPRFDLATAELCASAHGNGLRVYTWTVDAAEAMRALIRNGVDGIMTNYPERLREVAGKV